jgi:hypothetical protein
MRMWLGLIATVANLVCPRSVLAADSATPTQQPPTVLPQGRGDTSDSGLQRDLRGVPDSIKNLILTFDQNRDKYLQQQNLLQIKMKHASTSDERDQLRQQLQANRQEFLAELKSFRDELRNDLQDLRGKIGHAEFGRIIDAAHSVTTEGGHRHRGQ